MMQIVHCSIKSIYPNVIENVIGMKGDGAASIDRVSMWSSTTISIITSKINIAYIFNLNEK